MNNPIIHHPSSIMAFVLETCWKHTDSIDPKFVELTADDVVRMVF